MRAGIVLFIVQTELVYVISVIWHFSVYGARYEARSHHTYPPICVHLAPKLGSIYWVYQLQAFSSARRYCDRASLFVGWLVRSLHSLRFLAKSDLQSDLAKMFSISVNFHH